MHIQGPRFGLVANFYFPPEKVADRDKLVAEWKSAARTHEQPQVGDLLVATSKLAGPGIGGEFQPPGKTTGRVKCYGLHIATPPGDSIHENRIRELVASREGNPRARDLDPWRPRLYDDDDDGLYPGKNGEPRSVFEVNDNNGWGVERQFKTTPKGTFVEKSRTGYVGDLKENKSSRRHGRRETIDVEAW